MNGIEYNGGISVGNYNHKLEDHRHGYYDAYMASNPYS